MEYAGPQQSFHDAWLCTAVIADPFALPISGATLKALPPVKLLFFRPEVENVLKEEFHVSRVVRLPKAHHLSFLAPFPNPPAGASPVLRDSIAPRSTKR
jgi:hypothetical protein